ncbi:MULTISPECIES: sulfite exporter TauE/SafE family protein [Prolixibacter]|jgi:uncharacterized membrane protein YfcA|uniref:Probable membrane transporter protein n=1 Tax=Prolixibacter denitrificans TaxID=1541063 RepID=A0A2P8CKF2_9BACT|nr:MULTISPECIES: sulfite exporter TauE/SafE family protein [Prolixibacter]PSK85413.1 hypothetical protein CLV93_101369 [Prolixibacter denitrificans]GET20034.1 UPF0721 transmembrane protein [Prolixibacter denitrificans]GET26710.1 UPF0721 transmembrane protein [Prolixibacter sp. NT017]
MELSQVLLLVLVGFTAGIVSGALGVGGGIVLIPALVYLFGMEQHTAQGTSLAILLPPTGILAAMAYQKQGFINWKYAIIITLIFVLGAWVGAQFSIAVPEKLMRRIFALFLLIVGAKMFFGK